MCLHLSNDKVLLDYGLLWLEVYGTILNRTDLTCVIRCLKVEHKRDRAGTQNHYLVLLKVWLISVMLSKFQVTQ